MSGTLYVVATPLGNLEDLSSRALATLRSVDAVLCEDTRRTSKLLARYEIGTSTVSCHRFNERRRLETVLAKLQAGQNFALVSDGGTPGVADPGSLLVQAALEAGLTVVPLPGPSAVATLLSASGLPADRYVFEGFLPHRAGERRRRLREIRSEPRTIVMFEAPHRILGTLRDIREVIGERMLVLGRELTKVHESILRGSAEDLARRLGPEVRGEITLAMGGADEDSTSAQTDAAAGEILGVWRNALREAAGSRHAALRRAATVLGLKRAELYRRLAELGERAD